MKKFVLFILIIIGGALGWMALRGHAGKGTAGGTQPAFNRQQSSLDEPASIWVVVNKHRPLQPPSYAPTDLITPTIPLRLPGNKDEMLLRSEPALALGEMYQAGKQDGLDLMVASAYRSYNYQKGLYNGYVARQGQAVADSQSARPGYSEHQTGLAVDLEPTSRKCEVEACFADTPEGKWLAANAYKYGFIIRYPKDKQAITGYIYEPWHLRYVGKVLAAELHKRGNPTLEEFFNLGAAPDYL
jgi:D-alanyl-D-alanine carboxypeptidase